MEGSDRRRGSDHPEDDAGGGGAAGGRREDGSSSTGSNHRRSRRNDDMFELDAAVVLAGVGIGRIVARLPGYKGNEPRYRIILDDGTDWITIHSQLSSPKESSSSGIPKNPADPRNSTFKINDAVLIAGVGKGRIVALRPASKGNEPIYWVKLLEDGVVCKCFFKHLSLL